MYFPISHTHHPDLGSIKKSMLITVISACFFILFPMDLLADRVSDSDKARIDVDGKVMYVASDDKKYSFRRESKRVYRFELRSGDQGFQQDAAGIRHRTEVVTDHPSSRYGENQVVWRSWSIRIADQLPFKTAGSFFLLSQYHSVDRKISRSPPLAYDYGNARFQIWTRSDKAMDKNGNGIKVVRFVGDLPTAGVWTHFVERVSFGLKGSLSVWRDGTKIIDEPSTPIGYFNDRGPLGYLQFGIYGSDIRRTAIVWYANIEWGSNDLSDRIRNPLPIVP